MWMWMLKYSRHETAEFDQARLDHNTDVVLIQISQVQIIKKPVIPLKINKVIER